MSTIEVEEITENFEFFLTTASYVVVWSLIIAAVLCAAFVAAGIIGQLIGYFPSGTSFFMYMRRGSMTPNRKRVMDWYDPELEEGVKHKRMKMTDLNMVQPAFEVSITVNVHDRKHPAAGIDVDIVDWYHGQNAFEYFKTK